MNREYILVINPGSTSTKVSIFKEKENVINTNLNHDVDEISKYEKISDQFNMRKESILNWLNENNINQSQLICAVGRGGLLRPISGGTYEVTDCMLNDLQIGVQGEHASNLGGIIARSIATEQGIASYIVDPVSVDEFEDIARISGIPEIKRRSLGHTLNIKAVARKYLNEKGFNLEDKNLIVAHLGGGISVAPLKNGKIIDYNNANEMGPFSPERVGGLPIGDLVKLCFSKKYTEQEIKKKLRGNGGLVGYLGTNDAREITQRIENGDQEAQLIYEAMGYQISKEIGAMATVINGDIEAVILTGGLAYSKYLTDYIINKIGFIAPVHIEAGENEMKALNEGALRVIKGEEISKIYEEEVKC